MRSSSDHAIGLAPTLKTVADQKRGPNERRQTIQCETVAWTSHKPQRSFRTPSKRKLSLARQATDETETLKPLVSPISVSSSSSSPASSPASSRSASTATTTVHNRDAGTAHQQQQQRRRPVFVNQCSVSDETEHETQSAPASPTGSHKRIEPLSPMKLSSQTAPRRLVPILKTPTAPVITGVLLPPAIEVLPPTSVWKYFKLSPKQVVCPACNMDISTVPLSYWKERDEIILCCSNVTIDRKSAHGFRICGNMWTPSELTPRCECGAHSLTIEKHYGSFFYVCTACHVTAFETRSGKSPTTPTTEY